MQNTKSVVCVHDLSCVGRCSLSVALPVLAVMGLQPCALPCAVRSANSAGFGVPAVLPTSQFLAQACQHFQTEKVQFDSIYTGYLASAQTVEAVLQLIQQNPAAITLVDTVMGDEGKLYGFVDETMLQKMRILCKKAHIITPNCTESNALLGITNTNQTFTQTQAVTQAQNLQKAFQCNVVLTGVPFTDGTHGCCVLAKNKEAEIVPYKQINGRYHGTGDLFASVLLGSIWQNKTLLQSVQTACQFVSLAVQNTPNHTKHGLVFEPLLYKLAKENEPQLWK